MKCRYCGHHVRRNEHHFCTKMRDAGRTEYASPESDPGMFLEVTAVAGGVLGQSDSGDGDGGGK